MSTRNDTPDSASVPTRLVNISAPGKRSSVERDRAQKWLTALASDFSERFTSDMDNTTDGTWDSLPVRLNEKILETLAELKFTHTTPVQVTCTPQTCLSTTVQSTQHLTCDLFSTGCVYSAVHEQQRCGC